MHAPISFLFDPENRKICFHGARATRSPGLRQVCFTVCGGETPLRDEAWAPYMQSVVVFGRCRLMEKWPGRPPGG